MSPPPHYNLGFEYISNSNIMIFSSGSGEVARVTPEGVMQFSIEAKDEYIACYKTGKRPTEKLFAKLEKLIADLGMK